MQFMGFERRSKRIANKFLELIAVLFGKFGIFPNSFFQCSEKARTLRDSNYYYSFTCFISSSISDVNIIFPSSSSLTVSR